LKLKITETFSPLPEFGHKIQQSVMTLITIADGQIIPVGTGFTISVDGLMMTAVHVIEQAVKKMVSKRYDDGRIENHLEFYALYLTDKRHGQNNDFVLGGLLPIHKVWFLRPLDVGFCFIRRPIIDGEPLRFPVCRLSPGLPKVGENILGFGYYGMEGGIQGETQDGQILVDYRQETAFTGGKIVEVFQQKRDSSMLNFPCFRTDARFEHGMSGGPIMNEKGYVCGVICSSLPSVGENPEYISYGSLIWPIMGTSIEVAQHEGAKPEMMLLYDLIQKGYIFSDETIANIKVDLQPDGQRKVSILN